jgi:hypothetical protein
MCFCRLYGLCVLQKARNIEVQLPGALLTRVGHAMADCVPCTIHGMLIRVLQEARNIDTQLPGACLDDS